MRIVAVILNWNNAALTERAAESVAAQVDRVYLVDNASRPGDRARLATYAAHRGIPLLASEVNGGYAAGNNLGIARALEDGCDAVLVMNNDALAEPGSVALLAARLEANPAAGAVMPAVVALPGGAVLHTACSLDLETGAHRWVDRGLALEDIDPAPRPSGYVSGEAFLARADTFRRCGNFDERFFCYFEDAEWSARVRRAGWEIEVVPLAVVRHALHSSTGSLASVFYMARNRPLFLRWGLGKSRLASLRLSARRELLLLGSLLRRRQLRMAARGALAGWAAGVALVLLERRR